MSAMNSRANHQRLITLPLVLFIGLTLPVSLKAQSDNFDSGSLSAAWQKYYANPALVSFTFPTVGNGKGLRIQSAPVSGVVPAVAAVMQTNEYTDFYVALDIVNWVVEDQAIVVCGRFTPGGDFGLDGGTGMILNYDAAQAGDSPTSRKGGQFQINTVAPGFNAGTLAACDMTLVPGRSYRLVFKGAGTSYTGQVYDLNDLSAPLATLHADDATYTSGISGFLSFSRNGTSGTTDVTIDNYYAAVNDPNLAAPPALMHPIPGTPMVETRVPAARWQNFHNPALGISFTAKTYTTDVINSAATRLRLNGLDVSSQLSVSANGTTITGTLPGSALKSNAVYSAQIEVADTTGTKTSVNSFWFDTFSDSYLNSSVVKVIECEDYNYSNGVYQLDPITVSGMNTNDGTQINGNGGAGYYDQTGVFSIGTEGVDFHTTQTTAAIGWNDYRMMDPVMTGEGIRQEIEDVDHTDIVPPWGGDYNRPNDNTRKKYADLSLVEYLVIRTHAGDWLNYTRAFVPTNYFAFLRVGAFADTSASLSQVTSDPTAPNQTTVPLGTFHIPDTVRRSNFRYIPLLDTNTMMGVILNLAGTNTLRLTLGGAAGADDRVPALNYLLLVPAQVTLQSSTAVTGPFSDDTTATVDVTTRTITLPMSGAIRFYRLNTIVPMSLTSISASGGMVKLGF